MRLKSVFKPLAFTLSAAALCSCSGNGEIKSEAYVMTSGATECLYEAEAFDCVSNGSRNLITYYSAAAGKCVPICTKPNCTHESDDCTAVVDSARGMLKTEDGLMFFDYGEEGELNLIKSDYNGSNRRVIAALDNLMSYTWTDAVYGKDSVLCIYRDMVGFEEIEDDQTPEMADEYTNRIVRIDVNGGEASEILCKKDHAAAVSNALIYEGKLIYSYQHYTRDIRKLSEGEKLGDYYLSGFYSLDLDTGEEKKLSEGYDKMMMTEQSFNYFNPERIICHNLEDGKLYLYSMNTNKFSPIGECGGTYNNFAADGDDLFYFADSDRTQYTRYSLETDEISFVPPLPENCNLSCIVGSTVWVTYKDEEGRYSRGWISKDDFVRGNHSGLKFAYFFNSLDGSVKY